MGTEINPDLWLKVPWGARTGSPHGGMKPPELPSALQVEIAR
jgi:hypothetical protein